MAKAARKPAPDASSALLAAEGESEEEQEPEQYEVEDIISERGKGKTVEYYVKWVGYGPEHNTWEPESNLTDCDLQLEKYRARKESAKSLPVLSVKKTTPAPKSSGKATGKATPPASSSKAGSSTIRVAAKRGIQHLPDDRSSSSKSDSANSPPPAKRQSTGRVYSVAAAAALVNTDSDSESEDLPLGEAVQMAASVLKKSLTRSTSKNSRSASKNSRSASNNSVAAAKNSRSVSNNSGRAASKNGATPFKVTRSNSKSSLAISTNNRAAKEKTASEEIEGGKDGSEEIQSTPRKAHGKSARGLSGVDEEEIPPPPTKSARKTRADSPVAPRRGRTAPSAKDTAPAPSGDEQEETEAEEEVTKRVVRERLVAKKAEVKKVPAKKAPAKKNGKKVRAASTSKDAEEEEEAEGSGEEAGDGEGEEYEVDEIIGAVLAKGGVKFALVKWKDYPLEACTWEKEKNLGHADWALKAFYKKHGTPNAKKARILTKEGALFDKQHKQKKGKK